MVDSSDAVFFEVLLLKQQAMGTKPQQSASWATCMLCQGAGMRLISESRKTLRAVMEDSQKCPPGRKVLIR